MKPFLRTSALLSAVLVLTTTSAASSLPGWYTDFDQALAVARREGKPLLADIGSENCPACRMLESQTLTHPEVKGRLDNFVKVQVDGNMSPHILQQFGVTGYPTVVALDPKGRVVGKSVGYVPAARFAGTLDSALQRVEPAEPPVAGRIEENEAKATRSSRAVENSEEEEAETASKPKNIPGSTRHVERTVADVKTKEAKPDRSGSAETEFTFYNMGAGSAAKTKTAADTQPSDTAPRKVPKVVAQAAPERSGDAVFGANLPTPADDVPKRLLDLDDGHSGKTSSPSPSPNSEASEKTKKQTAAETPKVAASSSTAQKPTEAAKVAGGLATIKKLQGVGDSKAQTASASPVSGRPAAGSASKEPTVPADPEDGADDEAEDGTSAAPEEGVTSADIRRWMEDANGHLKAGRKRQARAMYQKVVENDRENRYGRSDEAYIHKVALSVDADDDALRRQALNDIRKFKRLYPNSTRKDHYAVIHAILAADVGETDEAHSLLDNFRRDHPNSRFTDLAYKTWKQLPPPGQKASSKRSSASAESSGSSKSDSTAAKKPTSGSSSSSRSGSSSTKSAASSKSSTEKSTSARKAPASRTTADAKKPTSTKPASEE